MINRSQGRSVVLSTGGLVASEHPFASQAGASVLARGGHAVEAAVAANAVMGVVCPMMCGIGGDLFAIVWERDGAIHGVNASGWAPSSLPDALRRTGAADMPQTGIHSITVPGAVEGWRLLLSRFSRLTLAEILEPAVALADRGFPVAEITGAEWGNRADFLRTDPEAARVFLPAGRALNTGEIFRNPDLAWSYQQVQRDGAAAFYEGQIGRRLLEGLQRRGSAVSAQDLAEYRAEWASPISTTYREWEVFELPPNGAGIAALMMLNMLESFPMREYGANTTDALHALIEAKKLAYADMHRHVADPRFADVPVEAMLSKEYGRARASEIDRAKANLSVSPGRLPVHAGDTVYLCAVDRDGNMVSLIQSNFASFGSGIVAEGTGFPLQNRGSLFTLDPTHPNLLEGRKRPLHTIIPACMRRGDVRVAFGIMGGWNQSQAHAQFVSNVVDHGMNIQASLEAPRFTKLTFEGNDVMAEKRIPQSVLADLTARGHQIEVTGDYCSLMGGGQAVMRDGSTGVNSGGSDPRKDGAVVPEL